MDIKRVDEKEFGRLREEWNGLLDRSACDSVFLRWEWMHTWWDVFKQGRELLVLTARLDGRLVGVAPFFMERRGLLGTRCLKLCSEELSPDYLDIFAERGREADVTRDVAGYLLGHAAEWDMIDFDNLRAESHLLSDPSLFRNYAHQSWISNYCPYLKIAGQFEDYYKTRRGLVSFSLENKFRKLTDRMKITHTVISDESSLAKGIEDLFWLHEKRTSQLRIRSNFLSADVKRFHREISRQFLSGHILIFHMLYDGQAPVSANYSFRYKRKLFGYQNGFDPRWKKFSAGAVLYYSSTRSAFEQGLDECDFLKGMERYKMLWTDTVRGEMRLAVYNNSIRGLIGREINSMKTELRRIRHGFSI